MLSPNFEQIIHDAKRFNNNAQNVFIEHKGGVIEPALDFIQNDWRKLMLADLYDNNTRDYLWFDYNKAYNRTWDALNEQNAISVYAPGLHALCDYYKQVCRILALKCTSIDKANGRRLWVIEQKKIKKAQEAEARKKAREDAKINPVKDMLKYLRGRSEFCEMVASWRSHPAFEDAPEYVLEDIRKTANWLAEKYYKAAVSLAFAHVEGKGLAWAKEFAGYDPYNAGYELLFRFDITMKKIIRKYESKAQKDANGKA